MSEEISSAPTAIDVSTATPLVPVANEFFGPPPIIPGEEKSHYQDLLARVTTSVRPGDIFEEIWVKDFVDLVWEAFRLRRLKAEYLHASAHEGVEKIMKVRKGSGMFINPAHEPRSIANHWAQRDPLAVKEVDDHLREAGLTIEAVMAQTLAVRVDEVERIDRMIALAEGRRNAVLREIDRHRDTLGERLRRAARNAEEAQYEDAQYKVIGPQPQRADAAE